MLLYWLSITKSWPRTPWNLSAAHFAVLGPLVKDPCIIVCVDCWLWLSPDRRRTLLLGHYLRQCYGGANCQNLVAFFSDTLSAMYWSDYIFRLGFDILCGIAVVRNTSISCIISLDNDWWYDTIIQYVLYFLHPTAWISLNPIFTHFSLTLHRIPKYNINSQGKPMSLCGV